MLKTKADWKVENLQVSRGIPVIGGGHGGGGKVWRGKQQQTPTPLLVFIKVSGKRRREGGKEGRATQFLLFYFTLPL